MKKKSRLQLLAQIVIVIFTLGSLMAAHVGLKKKCDDLFRQRDEAVEAIKNEDNKTTNLHAKYQNLISADFIIPFASNQLDMVYSDSPVSVISIDKERVQELESLLREFHD